MTGAGKTEVSPSGFAPHIEELHDFFRSRSVRFGAPEDLGPFVERLSNDASFRDEMSSMVRATIYRERDGLTPGELLELLVTAVAGKPAGDASGPAGDAVRQMMSFIGAVFRSRWNPGGPATSAEDKHADVDVAPADVSPLQAENTAAMSDASQTDSRPVTPIFYQAQVVAHGGAEPEVVSPVREQNEAVSEAVPVVSEDSAANPAAVVPPVAAFLRSDAEIAAPPEAVERRGGFRGWAWVAVVLAIVAAFCAGMFVRQWMLVRSGEAGPVRLSPAPAVSAVAAPAAVNAGAPQPPANGAVGARGKTAQRRPAQVEAARSEWPGGDESATDVAGPASVSPGSATGADAGQGAATGATGTARSQPAASVAKPSPEVRANSVRSAEGRAAAMFGASPGLMGSRLLFAPEPEYPQLAKIAHIQGPVVVEALVGRDGTVVRARAISGHRMLRSAAERAVYGRRYRPYIVNDIPMAVRTLVTVNFELP